MGPTLFIRRPVLTTLFMLSALETAEGRHERAMRLFGAAEALREQVAGAAPAMSLLLGDPIGEARRAIGDVATDRALEEGRAMDPEAAVQYARERA